MPTMEGFERSSRSFLLTGSVKLTAIVIVACLFMAVYPANAITINEFPVAGNGGPFRITLGPDNNLWFTEQTGNKIGRMTTTGAITEFPVPTAGSTLRTITTGADGNLWFTEGTGNKIGRITPAGEITEFAIPTAGSDPRGIASGPDGNLWFTEGTGNKIGRITPSGVITEFPIPTPESLPNGITTGPDGNLWFVEMNADKIGRITPSGVITEFQVPTTGAGLFAITAGPDGRLWFTESEGNKIGRITKNGVITEFQIPTAGNAPRVINAGTDGNLWFTVGNTNRIGRITTSGNMTFFNIPSDNSNPGGITTGPDGNKWFAETRANKIGQVVLHEGTMPVPAGQHIFAADPPVVGPIIAATASEAKPIGIGDVAAGGSLFDIALALGRFAGPVDIYFALVAPAIDPANIFIFTPAGLSTVAAAGIVPWMEDKSDGMFLRLVENLPVEALPAGAYDFFLIVTPAGRSDFSAFYAWQARISR